MTVLPREWMAPFLTLLLLGCGGEGAAGGAEPEISFDGVWARAIPLISGEGEAATNSAAYLTIKNDGRVGDRLLTAASDVAEGVEIHESRMVNEMMVMERQVDLEIPAGSRVELKPGGLHLMLLGLRRSLLEGEEFELILDFEKSGELSIAVPVRINAGG